MFIQSHADEYKSSIPPHREGGTTSEEEERDRDTQTRRRQRQPHTEKERKELTPPFKKGKGEE